ALTDDRRAVRRSDSRSNPARAAVAFAPVENVARRPFAARDRLDACQEPATARRPTLANPARRRAIAYRGARPAESDAVSDNQRPTPRSPSVAQGAARAADARRTARDKRSAGSLLRGAQTTAGTPSADRPPQFFRRRRP